MSARTNLWVDVVIFVGFLVVLEPNLTGISIHEWLSVALALTLILHAALHWDWGIKIAAQFLRRLFHTSRLNFVVDVLLFAAFVLVMLSGILISRSVLVVLGIQVAESPTWRFLHSWSAEACLILTGLHFALHWTWIINAVTRYLVTPLRRGLSTRSSRPAESVVTVEDA
jgi:hypothetical protein